MASYYKKLKLELDGAAAEGIITPEQAGRVWERAYSSRTFGSFKAVHWIAAASGLFIALGVILIAAHNWDKIGAIAKMGTFLLLFAGAGLASRRFEEKPAAAIPLEILWFFMPALGIGLYAQIFNLSGDPVKPYLLWAALSIPAAVFLKRSLAAFLATALLFAILYFGTLAPDNMLSLINHDAAVQPPAHWALALLVIAAAFAVHFIKNRDRGLYLSLGTTLIWLFIMLTADTAARLNSEAMILLAGMSMAALWLLWSQEEDAPPKRLPLMAWLAAVYMMTFFWHYKPETFNYLHTRTDTQYGGIIAFAVFAAGLLTLALRRRPLLPTTNEDRLVKGLLAVSMLCAFFLFDTSVGAAKTIAVLANLILAAFGAACILSGAKTSGEKMINRGVAVIALTAITRFLDIFGGLLKSGLAFIATGLAFAALAYFINRGRRALIEAARK